ncbi:hypothetical protein [Bacillus mycoides]|uniref:hypothetical protein n=1 Tax=Bacillus mycoides TaxID=1405 RepID=UPI003D25239F
MIKIVGKKVVLKEATYRDFDELYYWKYEEKEQEARIRQARMVDSKYFDAIKMGILRKEWEQA